MSCPSTPTIPSKSHERMQTSLEISSINANIYIPHPTTFKCTRYYEWGKENNTKLSSPHSDFEQLKSVISKGNGKEKVRKERSYLNSWTLSSTKTRDNMVQPPKRFNK